MTAALILLALWLSPAILLGAFMLFSLKRDAAKRTSGPLSENPSQEEPAGSAEGTAGQIPASATAR
jgi:hypothetical protein